MKKILNALFFNVCMVSMSYSGTAATGWVDVTEVYVGSTGKRVNLMLSSGVENPNNCNYSSYYQADENNVNTDYVMSMALIKN